MLSTTIGEEDLLVVYGEEGETHEVAFDEADLESTFVVSQSHESADLVDGILSLRTQHHGLQSITLKHRKRDMRVLVADTATAYAIWQPVLREGDRKHNAFYKSSAGENVLVVGP
jgi:hypothetical protein